MGCATYVGGQRRGVALDLLLHVVEVGDGHHGGLAGGPVHRHNVVSVDTTRHTTHDAHTTHAVGESANKSGAVAQVGGK